ncbi:MAG: sigma-70 family RNA polymerase sigma factor [Fulvivirga sp.]|nr:sigma-70 family RNA polymerase sigma factor [Fulvivirga sp.]
MSHTDPDKALIDQVIAGDKKAYNQLVIKYQRYAFTIALNILDNREDAEEAAHDAFIKAYKHLKKFNRTSKFSTWLYRIVFNTAISVKRKQKTNTKSIESAFDIGDPSGDIMERKDRKKFIKLALAALSAADRTVITMFYLKDYTIEEISETVSMNINTVKVRLHRARKRLASQLQNILKEETLNL